MAGEGEKAMHGMHPTSCAFEIAPDRSMLRLLGLSLAYLPLQRLLKGRELLLECRDFCGVSRLARFEPDHSIRQRDHQPPRRLPLIGRQLRHSDGRRILDEKVEGAAFVRCRSPSHADAHSDASSDEIGTALKSVHLARVHAGDRIRREHDLHGGTLHDHHAVVEQVDDPCGGELFPCRARRSFSSSVFRCAVASSLAFVSRKLSRNPIGILLNPLAPLIYASHSTPSWSRSRVFGLAAYRDELTNGRAVNPLALLSTLKFFATPW